MKVTKRDAEKKKVNQHHDTPQLILLLNVKINAVIQLLNAKDYALVQMQSAVAVFVCAAADDDKGDSCCVQKILGALIMSVCERAS